MSTRNRTKRIQNRETRLTAMEEAKRRAKRRRWEIATGGVVLALIVAIVFVVRPGDDDERATPATTSTTAGATTTTTSSTPAAGSVAGKPCVAVSGPLPSGAPKVPVKTGPPPTTLVKEDLKTGDGDEVKPGATVTQDRHDVAGVAQVVDVTASAGTARMWWWMTMICGPSVQPRSSASSQP